MPYHVCAKNYKCQFYVFGPYAKMIPVNSGHIIAFQPYSKVPVFVVPKVYFKFSRFYFRYFQE